MSRFAGGYDEGFGLWGQIRVVYIEILAVSRVTRRVIPLPSHPMTKLTSST